jgi:hypothetical protein
LVRLEDKCAKAGVSKSGAQEEPLLAELMQQLLTVRLSGLTHSCLPIFTVGAADVVTQLHQIFQHYESQYQNQFCTNSAAHEELSRKEGTDTTVHLREISYWAGCSDCLKRFAEDCKLVGTDSCSLEQLESALALACAKSKRATPPVSAGVSPYDWQFQQFLRGLVEVARVMFPSNPPAVGMQHLLHRHLLPVARVITDTYSAVQGSTNPFASDYTAHASLRAALSPALPIAAPPTIESSTIGDFGSPASFWNSRPKALTGLSKVQATDQTGATTTSINEDGFDVWSQSDASALMGGSSPIAAGAATQGMHSPLCTPTVGSRCALSSMHAHCRTQLVVWSNSL